MRRDDGADREAELEAEGDVDQDADRARARSPACPASAAPRPTVGPTISVPTTLELADVGLLQRRGRPRRRCLLRTPPASAPTVWHANHHLLAAGSRRTAGRSRSARRRESPDRARRGPARCRRLLIELHDDDRAAGELDAFRHALGPDDHGAGEDDRATTARSRATSSGRSRSADS